MIALFATILALPGKLNFRNLSRFGSYCEKTYARHFADAFDFTGFNKLLLQNQLGDEVIAAIDTSFIPKSGKKTYGLDRFFDGCLRKARRGLELSVIALVDVQAKCAYTLSARQTPALPKTDDTSSKKERRMSHYIKQLSEAASFFPKNLRYIAADGAYARTEFFQAACKISLHVVTRLRSDANLRYLYQGPQKRRSGRKKRYDGKVDLKDVSRMDFVGELQPGIKLYTALVNSPHMKQDFRIAYLLDERKPKETTYIVLASTDLELSAEKIVAYYCQRFQIEFIFRDSKQHTGLTQAQARDKDKLDFHFNASLTALNIARIGWNEKEQGNIFSMASIKRISYNELFMDQLFLQLGFNPKLPEIHPIYQRMRSYGAIAA